MSTSKDNKELIHQVIYQTLAELYKEAKKLSESEVNGSVHPELALEEIEDLILEVEETLYKKYKLDK